MRIASRCGIRSLSERWSVGDPGTFFESTCVSNDLACCRNCAQPVPVEEAMVLLDS
jgi:hypothetical protein